VPPEDACIRLNPDSTLPVAPRCSLLLPRQTASGKTHTIHGPPSLDRLLASRAFPDLIASSADSSPDGSLSGRGGGGGPSKQQVLQNGSIGDTLEEAGLLYRLINGIFSGIAAAGAADKTYTFACQFIEIYKEGLRDLLAVDSARGSPRLTGRTNSSHSLLGPGGPTAGAPSVDDDEDCETIPDASSVPSGAMAGSVSMFGAVFHPSTGESTTGGLQIREDPGGGVFVAGATMMPVRSPTDVFEALAQGASQRSTATTKLNSRSSRSHSIFQLYVSQRQLGTLTTLRSTLTIVDLAGAWAEWANKSVAHVAHILI
jgi:hypothetical protein